MKHLHSDLARARKSAATIHSGEVIRLGHRRTQTYRDDYVVVGENARTKAAKAEALGVPILDEAGFMALLDRGRK